MNRVTLIGRLTRDPDIRYSQGDQSMCIASYTLAVDRRRSRNNNGNEPTADFISCKAFGKSGEFAEKYLHKGMKIAVNGHIQMGSYKKQDGTTAYTTDVVVDDHEFVESKGAEGNSAPQTSRPAQAQAPAQAAPAYQQQDLAGFMTLPDGIDEELPFS